MGIYRLFHTESGKCLLIATQYKDIEKGLTESEARTGKYHIEVGDRRGHVCNAHYSLARNTWVLRAS